MSLVEQVRKIASRGRMDDADVQVIFDAADELEKAYREVAALSELAAIVAAHDFPIGKRPDWPQDVAWLAHFIDSQMDVWIV